MQPDYITNLTYNHQRPETGDSEPDEEKGKRSLTVDSTGGGNGGDHPRHRN